MTAPLRAMTFNIRYAAADDGANNWVRRRDLVGRTIRRFGPDVLATQEGLESQLQDLRDRLGDYGMVGAGRDDGRLRGESVAIFFRCPRFSLVEQGHFWLSETPDTPGSRGWDSRHPRMVTWCTLRDVEAPGELLHVWNTHFDFRGETARRESAKLLRCRLESLGLEQPVILMGDFNCGEDDPPYRTLLDGTQGLDSADTLVDAYRCVHPRNGQPDGTRHDFDMHTTGERMDWILHSRRFETRHAGIDRSEFDGRFPSDHYPVNAVLQLAPPTSGCQTHRTVTGT